MKQFPVLFLRRASWNWPILKVNGSKVALLLLFISHTVHFSQTGNRRCPLSIVIYSVWKECNLSHQRTWALGGSHTANILLISLISEGPGECRQNRIREAATTGTYIIMRAGRPELVAWPQGSEHNGALRAILILSIIILITKQEAAALFAIMTRAPGVE